jgi:hypothetical protein
LSDVQGQGERARSRLFYRTRAHRGRKGERRSMSEADYAGLVTAAHQHLSAPLILIWEQEAAGSNPAIPTRSEGLPAVADLCWGA